MSPTQLLVEIHCDQPKWAYTNEKVPRPNYRLYLDDELITERTWLYSNGELIDETLYANLSLDTPHVIKITPVFKMPGQAEFIISNFRTPERENVILTSNDLSITFKIR